MCMEYHAPLKEWQVKSDAYKGTDLNVACCTVPAKCLPEACPVGKWKVVDSYSRSKYGLQPVIVVSLLRKEEVDAYRVELEREAVREVKGHHNVRISGAKGEYAGLINGVYKPANKMRGNVTVYQKIVGGEVTLEYCTQHTQWQVIFCSIRGTYLTYCAVPVKCLPEQCPAGEWNVFNGSKFLKQPDMKVRRHK